MKRLCFLTMDDLSGYVSDDQLAIGPLADLGWQVDSVSWRSTETDWNKYDIVVIRTTWDYHQAPGEFVKALRTIDRSTAGLENSLSLVEWNIDKRYLIDIAERGCEIVPTIWFEGEITVDLFNKWQIAHSTDELVLKPTISATAKDTFRLNKFDAEVSAVLNGRSIMIQPFLKNVVADGEYSLFYFNGEYSHTIIKRPKKNDYRVQEEHGGIIEKVEPEAELKAVALSIQNLIEPLPLYSRVDLVRGDDGKYKLMELELIEPALYFRMDTEAASRFALVLDKRVNEL